MHTTAGVSDDLKSVTLEINEDDGKPVLALQYDPEAARTLARALTKYADLISPYKEEKVR